MTTPIDAIQRTQQDKYPVALINDQRLQLRPSDAMIIEVTHWFHALQVVRNNQQVATFYKVAECIKYLLAG